MILKIIVHRLLWAVPILIGMSLLSFILMKASGGGIFEQMKLDPMTSKQLIHQYEHKYGLDKPLYAQYGKWLFNLFKGDLGYSFYFKAPVKEVIALRIKNTILLSFICIIIIWALALPLGTISAGRQNSIIAKSSSILSYITMCLPSFFLAFLLLAFAAHTGLLPTGSMVSISHNYMGPTEKFIDVLKHLAIPAFVISIPSAGALYRIVRSNVSKANSAPFSINARTRALPEEIVLTDYALKNSIQPLIVIFGYQIADILSGAALVEIVCNWPGLGSIMLTAVQAQDMHLVMASMIISGAMLIFGNLISDLLLLALDPRLREGML